MSTVGSYNLLVLVDQHAAHERIRLEKLIAGQQPLLLLYEPHPLSSELYDEEAYSGNVSGRQVLSSPIEPPLKFQLESQQLQLATTIFSKQLHAVGIELSQVCIVLHFMQIKNVLPDQQRYVGTQATQCVGQQEMSHYIYNHYQGCYSKMLCVLLLMYFRRWSENM